LSAPKSLLIFLLILSHLTWPLGAAATFAADFIIYQRQAKKVLPKVNMGNQIYLPLIEFLQMLDLPYSESISAGYVSISVGKSTIKLTKDRAMVQVNDASVGLLAPVVVATNRWLVSPDFVNKALNRVLPEKIVIGGSGSRFLIGPGGFNRFEVKAVAGQQRSAIVIQMIAPAEVEARREESQVILAFGNTPMDPFKEDYPYKDELVSSITFEDSPTATRLVVQLADKTLQTKVTHLSSQNVYLLEVTRQPSGTTAQPESISTQAGVIRTAQNRRKWHHITIDAGHGGTDRGALIKEGLYEKDVTLAIAKKIRWVLQNGLGVDTVITRVTDQSLSLEERTLAANSAQSDLFLSIHIGNWSHPNESGSYAYVSNVAPLEDSTTSEKKDENEKVASIRFVPWERAQVKSLDWSAHLAEILQSEMNRTLNEGNDSLTFRHAPLKLLSSLAMPAVLLEIGNASQPQFKDAISDPQFQNSVAATILAGLEKFRPLYERP
jgi:N-acetylmuramoyl-L-alanine amidase